jgi:hypothetical protein
MVAACLEKVANWKAVLAAMLYFATFLSAVYGCYAFIRGAAFIESFAVAYPLAFSVCGLLFAGSVAVERLKSSIRKSRRARNTLPVHSYVHH